MRIRHALAVFAVLMLAGIGATAATNPSCQATPSVSLTPGQVAGLDSPRSPRWLDTSCFCKAPHPTSAYTGSGANCTAANQSVFAQADAWVRANACSPLTTDGLCYESTVFVTSPCALDPDTGLYQESGHITWKCLFCG